MAEVLPDGLVVVDGHQIVRFANRRAQTLLGISAKDLSGATVREAVPLTTPTAGSGGTPPTRGAPCTSSRATARSCCGPAAAGCARHGASTCATARAGRSAGSCSSIRDASAPAARRAGPRGADLDDRPRAALAADLGQGLLGHPAAQLGPFHRRTEALHARDDRDRRGPGLPGSSPSCSTCPAWMPAGSTSGCSRSTCPRWRSGTSSGWSPSATPSLGSSSRPRTTCRRCGPTLTGSTRSSPT